MYYYKTVDWALTAERILSMMDSNELLASKTFCVRAVNITDVVAPWCRFRIASCDLDYETYSNVCHVGGRDVGEVSRKTEVSNDLTVI